MQRIFSKKVLIAVLCSVALLVTSLLSAAALGALDRSEKKLFDQLVEQDGFLFGINYPWIEIGHTLTGNELMEKYSVGYDDVTGVGLDNFGEEAVYEGLVNLKAVGFDSIGYWGSVYGEGVIYDDYGNVTGVKEDYLENIDRFLNICKRADMSVLWIVHAHSDALIDSYGENGKQAWDIISQMIVNPEVTEQYIENFVRPVMKVLSKHTDTLALISAGCEAENEITDPELGNHFSGDRVIYGTTQEKMKNFLNRITETAAEELPEVARTLVTNASYISMYNDVDLDVIGVNSYQASANMPDIENKRSVHPMIASEWGLGTLASEEQFTINTMRMQEDIENDGYLASYWWAYTPGGNSGDQFSVFNKNSGSQSDFRPMMYSMHYHIMDYKNNHHGIESYLDKPTMFYNSGSGLVEWIASRQASAIDIERSLDGGETWVKLVEGAAPADYETDYKGSYTDTTLPTSGSVMYRVIARDGEDVAVSDPSNENEILPPAPELIVNGSFEDGLNGWRYLYGEESFASDEFATHGEHSLYLTGGAWQGVIQENIQVEGGKRYKISYQYKKDPDDTAKNNGYVWIRYGDGGGTEWSDIQLSAGHMNTTNMDWVYYETTFVVPAGVTELAVDIRTDDPAYNNNVRSMFFIDEVSLKQIR